MLEFPSVLTKADFAARYAKSEFGNMSPTWTNLKMFELAMLTHPPDTLYHLRNGKVQGGETYYRQTADEVRYRWSGFNRPEDWYVSMQVPRSIEQRLLIQGEVVQVPDGPEVGLALWYSTVPKPMREALKEQSRQVYGTVARCLLEARMCPNSYEWLQVLLRRYEYHVVEFSTYDCEWGNLPGYNTVFWEIRNY